MIEQKTILIVEDELSLLLVLHDRLQQEGFKILQAKDGEEGLVSALTTHPDLILLDLLMPVMDGIELLQKLREDVWGKDAKVIVLTNLNENEKMIDAQKYGVSDFLLKADWKIEEVVEKIRQTLAVV